jgi:hypothetical protein
MGDGCTLLPERALSVTIRIALEQGHASRDKGSQRAYAVHRVPSVKLFLTLHGMYGSIGKLLLSCASAGYQNEMDAASGPTDTPDNGVCRWKVTIMPYLAEVTNEEFPAESGPT